MASCQIAGRQGPAVHPSTDGDDIPAASVIAASLDRVKAFVDPLLEQSLQLSSEASPRLRDAMRHSLLAPGKRLRPALVLWAAEACGRQASAGTASATAGEPGGGPPWAAAAAAAVAVEMIHAYSLVHDDLPAMDDDDLRRGRPTCHRAFDEATAILCGDALQALAFETLAAGMNPKVAARGCLVLARAAGAEALVGGQADDLSAERGWISDLSQAPAAEQVAWLERIHRRKTGRLFLAALELGGLSAGATDEQLAMLAAYGRGFGLAFQIADDLLDAEGTEASVGKRVGKDAERGKLTFPSVVGLESSRARGEALVDEAVAAVAGLGDSAEELVRLARWIIARDH
jgi:geranylgeranyl diphosphate synthase type II